MNRKLVSAALVLGVVTFSVSVGCKKSAPLAYDVPDPTPTPAVGAINVYVLDHGAPVSNIGVSVVSADTSTSFNKTNFGGNAIFNPGQLTAGTWLAQVPTQGKYYLSNQNFTVTGGGQYSVTFTADGQSLSAAPSGPTSYSLAGNYIYYNLSYFQPFNLNVPVSLTVTGLPSGWAVTYSSPQIGDTTNSASVTFTVPMNSYQQPELYFYGTASDTQSFKSLAMTITRNFPITFTCNYDYKSSGSGNSLAKSLTVRLNTLNGPIVPWSGTYSIDGSGIGTGSTSASFNGGITYSSSFTNNNGMITATEFNLNSSIGAVAVSLAMPAGATTITNVSGYNKIF